MMPGKRIYHVLIVEDEMGDARLMELAISRGGFPVSTRSLSDGREAMTALRGNPRLWPTTERPDLILLDLKMAGQGGLDFLAAVKDDATLHSIPVVVVTASPLESDVRAAYRLGAAGYLQKPVDLDEFMANVRILGDYWFKLVRLRQNGG